MSKSLVTHTYRSTRTTLDRFLTKRGGWEEEGVILFPLSDHDMVVLKRGAVPRNITF